MEVCTEDFHLILGFCRTFGNLCSMEYFCGERLTCWFGFVDFTIKSEVQSALIGFRRFLERSLVCQSINHVLIFQSEFIILLWLTISSTLWTIWSAIKVIWINITNTNDDNFGHLITRHCPFSMFQVENSSFSRRLMTCLYDKYECKIKQQLTLRSIKHKT